MFVPLLLSLWLMPTAPTGVDGQWLIAAPGGGGSIFLELKSDGGRLTGSLSGPNGRLEVINGSIAGNAIAFETVMKLDRRMITVSHTGQIDGDEMHLTAVTRGLGIEERFTAKRRDANAPPPDWFSESPAPDEVLAWLKANAVGLASVQPESAFADMMPLEARLKDARVVAMGEATHGTREFFQLKHRMLQFLVEELGFTVFGIEGNWPESLKVNEYVLDGKGDPAAALAGLYFWTWQTEEVLDLIRWMRQYNQYPAHMRKLKFYGFDMQTPGVAESNVLEYLRRVDKEGGEKAAQAFAILGRHGVNKIYEKASAETKRHTAGSLAAILRRFDERKQEYIKGSSQDEWTMTRQNMVIVKQAEVQLGDQSDRGRAFRDRAMAENVKWILDHEPPGTKMMLWAHNGHLAGDARDYPSMGAHLRRIFGDRAALCGFLFHQGSFRAIDTTRNAMSTFTLGLPPKGSLDATFAAISVPLFAVDLRHLPDPTTAKSRAGFDAPHGSRQIGAGYSEATAGVYLQRMRAKRAFDLLIFVEKTMPSRLF